MKITRAALLRLAARQEALARSLKHPGAAPALYLGDFREIELPPESIDLIITDPPYAKEYLPLFTDLSRRAELWLKPGGSLLVMSGQSYLEEAVHALSSHLTYRWELTYLTPGGQSAQLWDRTVNTFWKCIFWHVKGHYEGPWIGDVCKSAVNDNDKDFHDWGQSESGLYDLMMRFCQPGQRVLDPMMGAGTTGVVATRLGCEFIGIDVSEEPYQTARKRLCGRYEP